jgi:ABC-type Zn uptake system ZnuABC Zn-binding protein ZnuA
MPVPPIRRWVVVALALATASTLVAACGDDGRGAGAGDAALSVVATTSVLGDFAQQIGGDQIRVDTILSPTSTPTTTSRRPATSNPSAADVVLRNGAGLEAWFDDTIEASDTRATLVDTSAGVTLRHGGHNGHGGDDDGDADPHIWQDPRNAIAMVTTIADAFSAADPDGAPAYAANLERYTGELDALDAQIEADTSTLANKKLVTNHDAFGYYADRYGFEIVGSVIPSFDTSAELSAHDLDDLIAAIRAERVKAVFSETSLPGDAARTIADEAGVTVVEGEDALYGDGLGPEGSGGATYLEMMRHNTATIVTNLR